MKWVERFRERRRGARPPGRVDWPFFIVIVLSLVGLGYVVAHPLLKRPPLVERDFTARVVDKSLTIRESDRALPPSMILLVEDRGGRRFRVGVTGEFYGRARVGMWASRRRGELRLSWEEPGPDSPGGGGGRVGTR